MKKKQNGTTWMSSGRLLSMVAGICLVLINPHAWAAIDTYDFADDETRERFHVLSTELRCPKCQNQNLADSNAPIAMDLRKEVYRLLSEGRSDREIKSYLVDRYGEYVLYQPAWSPQTWLLWVAPAILLICAFVVVIFIARRRARAAREISSDTPLSQQEQQRINQLLYTESQEKDKEN